MSDRKALIVIDLQNDYLLEKRKPMFTYDTETLMRNVNTAIRSYKEKGYDIIYIKHVLSKLMWGVGFSIKGTSGVELYEGLDVVSDLEKTGYSEVVLTGLDECGCVGATARGAARTGIKVKMLGDCIASRFPQAKIMKIREQLNNAGVEYI